MIMWSAQQLLLWARSQIQAPHQPSKLPLTDFRTESLPQRTRRRVSGLSNLESTRTTPCVLSWRFIGVTDLATTRPNHEQSGGSLTRRLSFRPFRLHWPSVRES